MLKQLPHRRDPGIQGDSGTAPPPGPVPSRCSWAQQPPWRRQRCWRISSQRSKRLWWECRPDRPEPSSDAHGSRAFHRDGSSFPKDQKQELNDNIWFFFFYVILFPCFKEVLAQLSRASHLSENNLKLLSLSAALMPPLPRLTIDQSDVVSLNGTTAVVRIKNRSPTQTDVYQWECTHNNLNVSIFKQRSSGSGHVGDGVFEFTTIGAHLKNKGREGEGGRENFRSAARSNRADVPMRKHKHWQRKLNWNLAV